MVSRVERNALLAACAAACSCFCGGATGAEDAPLVTDRPDQTESAVVVPRRSLQVEAGFLHSDLDLSPGSSSLDEVGQLLLRYGLGDALELRFAWDGWQWAEIDAPGLVSLEEDGAGDAAFGAKLALADERGPRPDIAVLAHVRLPVGDDAFSSDAFDPSFRFSFAHSLGERFSLGYNAGVAWETSQLLGGDETTRSRAIWTLALGSSLGRRAGVFVEAFGDTGLSDEGRTATLVDGGWTYLLRPNLQLDVSGGFGVSDAVEDSWFAGFGASWRWPD